MRSILHVYLHNTILCIQVDLHWNIRACLLEVIDQIIDFNLNDEQEHTRL